MTPRTAVPPEAWPALVPPAPQGLLCFQISHLNAGSETPLSSGGGQALGSVGSLLPSFPRGWAQWGLQGQAVARSAPGVNGSSVAAQPAPCETLPPISPDRNGDWVVCKTPAPRDGPVPGPRHAGRGLSPRAAQNAPHLDAPLFSPPPPPQLLQRGKIKGNALKRI